MNKIVLVALFLFLFAFSAFAKDRNLNVFLHFYKPITTNRAAFEDSVLTFYDVYSSSKGKLLANIGIVREDYSSNPSKQKFSRTDLSNLSVSEKKHEIRSKANRMNSEPSAALLKPLGIRRYERPRVILDNFFFLGETTDPSKNQYATCAELKKAIEKFLKKKKVNVVHVFMIPATGEDYKDADYNNRTFAYLCKDYQGKPFLDDSARAELSVYAGKYAESINAGNIDSDLYFANGTIRIGDSLDIESEKMNDFFFHNSTFSNLHYIYKRKTIEYVGFESNILFFSYWTEVECYRPATGKFEFVLVRMKVGLDREGKIVSLGEVEALGRLHADTNENPKKRFGKSSTPEKILYDNIDLKLPHPPPLDSLKNPELFVSIEPEYIDGIGKLYKDIYSNIEYPETERIKNISGTVYISFVVEWDGSVSEVVVERGVEKGPGLDKAAALAVSKVGFFRPAQLNGKTVRYRYRIPIKFTLR
jgi:TonB family protein